MTSWISPVEAVGLRQVLFSDDFEGGDLSKWDSSSYWSVINASADSDGKKARSAGNANGEAELSKMVSSTGYSDLTLEFSYRVAGYEADDVSALEYRADSSQPWQALRTYAENTESGWQTNTIYLPVEVSNSPSFGLRFVSRANGSNDMFYVDNVRLTGWTELAADTSGPAFGETSPSHMSEWLVEPELGASLEVGVSDESGVSGVRAYLISATDSDLRHPATDWLAMDNQGNGKYALELSSEVLTALVSNWGLVDGDEIEWQLEAEDSLGNKSQSVATLVYLGPELDEESTTQSDLDDDQQGVSDTDTSNVSPSVNELTNEANHLPYSGQEAAVLGLTNQGQILAATGSATDWMWWLGCGLFASGSLVLVYSRLRLG